MKQILIENQCIHIFLSMHRLVQCGSKISYREKKQLLFCNAIPTTKLSREFQFWHFVKLARFFGRRWEGPDGIKGPWKRRVALVLDGIADEIIFESLIKNQVLF